MEARFRPQLGELYDYYQMDPQLSECQYGFQDDQLPDYYPEPEQNPGILTCNSDSRNSPEFGSIQETAGVEESEAADELLQILMECLKKMDVRTREILLRKFFSEIERDTAMEGFLLDRIKHSKINSLLCESLGKIPGWKKHHGAGIFNWDDETRTPGTSVREVDVEGMPEMLERFKVKTVHVGTVVREEPN